jgi:hypothetical protein
MKKILRPFKWIYKKFHKRWHVRYKFNKKHLVFDIVLVGAVIFLIVMNVFWWMGGSRYFFDNFEIEISRNIDDVKSGDIVEFEINYRNDNKYEVEDVFLSFNFPEYFESIEVNHQDYDVQNNVLSLGSLAPGSNGHLTVKGQVFGSIDEEQYLFATFNYYKLDKREKRLWGRFSTTGFDSFDITNSYFDFIVEVPQKVVNDQLVDLTFTVKNTHPDLTFENLSIDLSANEQNIYSSELDKLEIEKLEPGKEQKIDLRAKISAQDVDQLDFLTTLVWDHSGVKLVQAKYEEQLEVVAPNFSVQAEFLNDGAVTPGDLVEVLLKYENKGKFSLENVVLSLDFIGDYWNVANSKLETGRISGSRVIFDAKEIPRLLLLQPGDSGEITFNIKTKQFVRTAQSTDLRAQSEISYKFFDNVVKIRGNLIEKKLNTNLALQVYPMYFTAAGDQLGRGPVPPEAGEETKYWIFAKVINDIHAVDDVKITATLPFNVAWTNKSNVPVGDAIEYNSSNKQLSWQISRIPSDNGAFGLAFEVAIIPSASQVGYYPILIKDIRIEGRDEQTGELIVKDLGNVTTKLINDSRGSFYDGPVR